MVVSSLVGFALVMAWRMRETARPITAARIVIPPLAMATGFGMFAYAPARIPGSWALAAFALGALVFSYPLVRSSRLVRDGNVVTLHRSRAFLWIIAGLFVVRFAARSYVEQYIDMFQTASLFFVLAFGMIVTWRVRMLLEYRKLLGPAADPVRVG
jgi:membrane protein CcdC involved in cytochrome C biogenesis